MTSFAYETIVVSHLDGTEDRYILTTDEYKEKLGYFTMMFKLGLAEIRNVSSAGAVSKMEYDWKKEGVRWRYDSERGKWRRK